MQLTRVAPDPNDRGLRYPGNMQGEFQVMNYRTAVKASLVLTGSVLLAGCSNWSFAPSMHGNPVTSTWTHPEVQDAASQGGAPSIMRLPMNMTTTPTISPVFRRAYGWTVTISRARA